MGFRRAEHGLGAWEGRDIPGSDDSKIGENVADGDEGQV